MANTPMHCPGLEDFKTLNAITCDCPACGHEHEIFSDEFEKSHRCKSCGEEIDFSKCEVTSQTGTG